MQTSQPPGVQLKAFDELSALQWHRILVLRTAAFVVEQRCYYPDADATDLRAIHLFTEDGTGITGYARLYQDHIWKIGRVVTQQHLRGKGIASQILHAAIDHLHTVEPAPEIELSAQLYLSPYYTRFGFKILGSMYLEDGIPHVRMVYQRS